jgi:tetratricopeptide (TPR) repeat protein
MSLKLWINGGSAILLALAVFLAPGSSLAAEGLEGVRELARYSDVPGAIKRLNRMLASDVTLEERVKARYLKGMLLLGEGDAGGAQAVFEGMVRDYPTLPEPYNNLAAMHASEGDLEIARELLVKVIEQHPDYVVALVNLGDVYARMAAESYDRARDLEPGADKVSAKLEKLDQLFEPAI